MHYNDLKVNILKGSELSVLFIHARPRPVSGARCRFLWLGA